MLTSFFPPGDYTSGQIQYNWRCSQCDETFSEIRGFSRGSAIYIPERLPIGWQKVAGLVCCPKHQVRITIDGYRVEEGRL